MKLYFENETNYKFSFDAKKIAQLVIEKTLEEESCPFDVEVNVLITNNNGIRRYNSNMRNIDAPTDVLSFPNLFYDEPSSFDVKDEEIVDYENPESGLIILGDIIINYERVIEQAEEYGHSVEREFAFLVAHSMYHLCGYDHMTEEEARVMEINQEMILQLLQITRD